VVKKTAVRKRETAKRSLATEQDSDGFDRTAEETAGKTKKKPKPVRCIHQHTDVEFRREFPKVFEALVEKAKEGGTAETRLLLQIGKFDDPKAARRRRGKSLSEMLMDELKRRQDEREAAADNKRVEEQMARTNETGGEGATSDGDAENG
jgi:cell division protein FtsN